MAIRPDGKIVAAGTCWTPDGSGDFALAWYDDNGSCLDLVSTDFGGDDDSCCRGGLRGGRPHRRGFGTTTSDLWPVRQRLAIACYDEFGSFSDTTSS